MTETAPFICILDANLLLRLSSKSDSMRPTVINAVDALLAKGAVLRTVPQALFEFWVVATRATQHNGLGLSVSDAESELLSLLQSFPILPDDPALVTYWRRLVVRYGVTGKQAHDAR